MGWNGSIYAGSARVGREMLRLWLLLGLALVKVGAYKNLAASYVTYDYYDSSYYAYYNNLSWYCSPSVGYADTCGPTCNSPESTWVFSPVCGTGCCGPQASDPGKLIDGNTSSKLILESLLVCDWENTFTFSFISPVTPKAIYIYLPNSAHSPVTTGECQVSVAYSDTQEEIYTGFNPVTLVQPNTWTYGTYAYYGFSTTISSMYWTVVLPGVTPSQKLPLCIAEMGFALASCPNNSVSGSNLFCTCNIGYYGTNGSAPRVACPAGYYQNSTKVTACIACPVASYLSSTASTGCVQCPTGYSTMTPGSPACQACSPGTYRSQPQTPCISCSVGTYQPNAQSTFCISCGVGSYQGTVGSSSCVSCPPGYFGNTSGASVCQLCPVGKYFNGTNATSCMACVAGKFTNTSGTASCAPCPTCSYQNATQATVCLMCPPTTAALSPGLSACAVCQPGTFLGMVYASPPYATCYTCTGDTYQNKSNATACLTCAPGTAPPSTGATACGLCGPGTYRNPAILGANASIVYSTLYPGCWACPPGSSQAASRATNCTPCVPGTYTNNSGQISCLSSGFGQYTAAYGATSDSPCALGTYQPASQATACLACAAGTAAPWNGMSVCTVCAAGTFAASGASACTNCPVNHFQPLPASASCTPCPVGQYQPGLNGTACFACPVGTYLANTQATQCTACSPGTYQNTTGATSCRACRLCPTGSYRSQGCYNATVDATCAPCTACPGGLVLRACTGQANAVCGRLANCSAPPAPARYPWMQSNVTLYATSASFSCERGGQYLRSIGSDGTIGCQQCPPGMVGLDGVLCTTCPPFQQPVAMDSASCVCSSPAFTNASGQCECPDGLTFSPALGCVPCPNNTFGLAGACHACPGGNYSGPGATACTACPVGQYRAPGQPACQACGRNRFALNPGRAGTCTACNASCPLGTNPAPCRVNASMFECPLCPPLPAHASWLYVAGLPCYYQCQAGFYHAQGACAACNVTRCPPGYVWSPCTAIQDGNCDVPCTNASKPPQFSVWTDGCDWACQAGYALAVQDYFFFTLSSCVPLG